MNKAPLIQSSGTSHGTEPRPLMPMSAVMWRLDLSMDDVQVLIGEGSLPWAFNIARESARRPAVRVLTESVEDLVYSRKRLRGNSEKEWQRVIGLILPDKPTMMTEELARALNCGIWTAMLLVHGQQFELAAGTNFRRGQGGSAQIVTASVVEWLRKRRIC